MIKLLLIPCLMLAVGCVGHFGSQTMVAVTFSPASEAQRERALTHYQFVHRAIPSTLICCPLAGPEEIRIRKAANNYFEIFEIRTTSESIELTDDLSIIGYSQDCRTTHAQSFSREEYKQLLTQLDLLAASITQGDTFRRVPDGILSDQDFEKRKSGSTIMIVTYKKQLGEFEAVDRLLQFQYDWSRRALKYFLLINEPIQNMPAQLDSGELVNRGGEYIRKYLKMPKSAIITPVGVRKYVYMPRDKKGSLLWNTSKLYMTCAYELDELEKKTYYVISLDCANGKVIDAPYDGPPTRRPAPKVITPKVLVCEFNYSPSSGARQP